MGRLHALLNITENELSRQRKQTAVMMTGYVPSYMHEQLSREEIPEAGQAMRRVFVGKSAI